MKNEKKSHLYLSYSYQDRVWVMKFTRALSQSGVDDWFDLGNVYPGEKLEEEAEKAFRESSFLVLILSPHSIESGDTYFYIGAAIASQKHIIPVMIQEFDISKLPKFINRFSIILEPSPEIAGQRVVETIEHIHFVESQHSKC